MRKRRKSPPWTSKRRKYDVVVSAVPLIEVGGEDGAGNAVLAVEVVRKVVAVVVGLYYYVVYRRSGYLYPALDVGVGCKKLVPVRVYRSIHERSNVDLLGLILTCGGVRVERVVVRVDVNETVLGNSSDIGDLRVGALIRANTSELRDQHADGNDENHDRHYQYDLAHLFAAGVIRLRERRIAEPRPAGLRPALYFILLLWGFMRLGVKIQLIDRDIP